MIRPLTESEKNSTLSNSMGAFRARMMARTFHPPGERQRRSHPPPSKNGYFPLNLNGLGESNL